MIELTGISQSFGGRVVLDAVDLSVPPGRTTVLIGPSGCGKSTLLRVIIGLIVPQEGTVEIGGRRLSPETSMAIRRGVGYVIQDGGLFPHLSARDNVAILAKHLRWEASRIEARLAELAELTHFPPDGLDRFPSELSGGQRQRLGLMRALMLDPPIILLDEPLGALDPMVRADLQNDLKAIFQTLKKSVVLVTHDLAEAAWFGDEIVLMRDGRIVQRGSYAELVNAPPQPFVAQFVRAQRQVQDFMTGAATP